MATTAAICRLCRSSAAMCCCTCTAPPLPICSNCMLTHLAATGTHVIQPLPPPTASLPDVFNEFCGVCRSAIPETVCCCESAGVLLCGKCIFDHNTKNAAKVHILLPVKARPFVSSPGYLERLRGRQTALDGGLSEARKSIVTIGECEQEVVTRTEKAIETITKYREDRLTELKAARKDLEQSITAAEKEVRDHIFEDTYVPTTPLSTDLWSCRAGQLALFSYSFDGWYEVKFNSSLSGLRPGIRPFCATPKQTPTSTPQDLSPRSATSQEFPSSVPLLRIQPHLISYFNPQTDSFGRQTTLRPSINISHMSSAATLPNGKIFVCGREHPVSNIAFEIDPQSGSTKALTNMITRRFAHAVVAYKNCVYVFGGTGAEGTILRDCEKYTLTTNDWGRISSMKTARDFFNPCTIRQFVLILGGRGTNLCEKYDIGNDSFADLSIKVPAVGQTVAIFRDDRSVLVIQSGNIYCWTQDRSELTKLRAAPQGPVWGTMTPALLSNCVYVPQSYQARILKIPI